MMQSIGANAHRAQNDIADFAIPESMRAGDDQSCQQINKDQPYETLLLCSIAWDTSRQMGLCMAVH